MLQASIVRTPNINTNVSLPRPQAAPRAAGEPPLQRGLPGPHPVAGAARAAPPVPDGGPLAELPALAGCASIMAADLHAE